MMEKTIVAVATPIGMGGTGVIRVSGPDSFNIVDKIFSKNVLEQKPNSVVYGNIFNKKNKIIDDVLVTKFQGPHSYTGEDTVEISCHGNVVILDEVIETLLDNGAYMAGPGEFTKRSFLNGKLDLSQAEAVNDLIKSSTKKSKDFALSQLKGSLGTKMKEINHGLMDIRASIEASIDFPEDVEEPDRDELISKFKNNIEYIEKLINSNEKSFYFRDGMKVSLVGNVNVGKSSILNGLLNSQRAIVTNIPGTTRDVLTESIDINGIPVLISDTAGVRDTEDIVEKIGVEKSLSNLEEADLVLMVFDASRHISQEDKDILDKVISLKKDVVYILNKRDIPESYDISQEYIDYLLSLNLLKFDKKGNATNDIFMSVNYPIYFEDLKNYIYEYASTNDRSESLMITNTRHIDALKKALNSLNLCLESLKNNMEFDFISIDLADAMYNLGLITGETTTEDILDYIFSEFCIGK